MRIGHFFLITAGFTIGYGVSMSDKLAAIHVFSACAILSIILGLLTAVNVVRSTRKSRPTGNSQQDHSPSRPRMHPRSIYYD